MIEAVYAEATSRAAQRLPCTPLLACLLDVMRRRLPPDCSPARLHQSAIDVLCSIAWYRSVDRLDLITFDKYIRHKHNDDQACIFLLIRRIFIEVSNIDIGKLGRKLYITSRR